MSAMAQLNLRPNERRILVAIGFLIFVVLNWTFVRPLFGQWDKAQKELEAARKTQQAYQTEIAKAPTYKALEEELRREGNEVLSEQLQLQRIVVEQHAAAAGIVPSILPISAASATSSKASDFFENQVLRLDFSTYSTNFVEWLVALATGNNAIRVEDMTLKPDTTGQKISGTIKFVASYKRKTPARSAPSASTTTTTVTTNATGAKPPAGGWAAPSSSTNRPAPTSPSVKPSTTAKPSTNATKPPKK
jgi:hypothetical protein